ncbi:MAG: hypothetical protein EPO07_09285 [Verrucomicrobia bacterium]|nr:MAG: hypothetical protein EPO07_09285 [Verrucomicrobiota bacterium]
MNRARPILFLVVLAAAALHPGKATAQVRDGGVDPRHLGKGDWIYGLGDATNRLGGNVASVTNETSLLRYYTNQGINFLVVKAARSDQLFNGTYPRPQFTSNLVELTHNYGLKIFGYVRSFGSNVVGEAAMADYVFRCGADGFVFDAEAEWESSSPWIGTNGPALAWQLCSLVRSNWPDKFLAHAPFPIIGAHDSFPYREFGYWCDAVMPQDYWKSIGVSPAYMVQWRALEFRSFYSSLTNIWTNAIKPIAPIAQGWTPPGERALSAGEVTAYFNALKSTNHFATAGDHGGVSFWRADLHSRQVWEAMRANPLPPLESPPRDELKIELRSASSNNPSHQIESR